MRFATAAAATVFFSTVHAWADPAELEIFSPIVEQGDASVENNSAVTFDKATAKSGQHTLFGEIGYGVTESWGLELEGKWATDTDGLRFRTVNIASAFTLLRQVTDGLDGAVFVEYDQAVDGRSSEGATIAALATKDVGRWNTTANLFFDKELGRNASTGISLRYSMISTWNFDTSLGLGVEAFGRPGKIGRFGLQDHRLGPAIAGTWELEGIGSLEYSAGYVFGLNPAAPNGTIVWRLEYSVHF